jgi:site-specific recombinase XerD
MVNKFSVIPFLNPHVNKAGFSKLYMQVTINRKVRRYPIELFIIKSQFDDDKKRVKSGEDKNAINRIILRNLNQVNDIYLKLRERNETIDFDNFEALYLNKDRTSFKAIVAAHLKSIGKSSHPSYKTVEREILALFGDNVAINDLDEKAVRKYCDSLTGANNTIWNKHKVLKALINTAIKMKVYKMENPFNNISSKYIQTKRTFLNMDEVNSIEANLEKMSDKTRNVAEIFLFQVYTGLRYSDISTLQKSDIEGNFIVLKTEKTDEIINIPIIDKARIILDKNIKPGLIFSVPTNQKFNDYLKLVQDYARIEKNLTSHVARHTFAVNCIDLGFPLNIISKLMGHKDIKTTEIYAQIMNPVLSSYMERWNN